MSLKIYTYIYIERERERRGGSWAAIIHRMAQANKALTKWKPLLTCSWVPKARRIQLLAKSVLLAFLLLDFEHVDADERSFEQNCKLECQNCIPSGSLATSPVAARRPMVETHALNGAQVDLQVQHRFSEDVQGPRASLGRTHCSYEVHSSRRASASLSWSSVVAVASTSAQAHERQLDRTSPTKI